MTKLGVGEQGAQLVVIGAGDHAAYTRELTGGRVELMDTGLDPAAVAER